MKRKRAIETQLPPHHCSQCDKEFYIARPGLYAYKINKGKRTKYYCSYSCYRKAGGDSGKYESWTPRNR